MGLVSLLSYLVSGEYDRLTQHFNVETPEERTVILCRLLKGTENEQMILANRHLNNYVKKIDCPPSCPHHTIVSSPGGTRRRPRPPSYYEDDEDQDQESPSAEHGAIGSGVSSTSQHFSPNSDVFEYKNCKQLPDHVGK